MKTLPRLKTRPFLPGCRRQQGFSLVEVTLALGIMAFCIVPIFGLLPVGINSNQASINQTRAASVAANLCADVRSTSLTINNSPQFNVNVSTGGSTTLYFSEAGDSGSNTMSSTSHYRATVTVTQGTGTNATWLQVLVTWPAAATAANAAGQYQAITSINRS